MYDFVFLFLRPFFNSLLLQIPRLSVAILFLFFNLKALFTNITISCSHNPISNLKLKWSAKSLFVASNLIKRREMCKIRLHCSCDERFYDCLHSSEELVSAKVGFLYFSVLDTKCFREDYPIVGCKRHSLWVVSVLELRE